MTFEFEYMIKVIIISSVESSIIGKADSDHAPDNEVSRCRRDG
jgi:hypothetical protein